MVSPRLIPSSAPLASINDVFNGILLDCDMVGKVMFYGPGAGKLPTASAVCADIVDIAAHGADAIKLPTFAVASKSDIADFSSYACRRLFIFKRCEGCEPKVECAEKLFGKIDKLSLFGDTVAVITAEPMREDRAANIAAKLSGAKVYRLL
jgi:homoserine dehydrogenase